MPSQVVLAGHSLGAGILMNSVSQALAYEYARASSKRDDGDVSIRLESPANLVVLLNPAMESVYLRQLRASNRPKKNRDLYPWVVSLTSESDWVTQRLFPLAHTWPLGNGARESPYFECDWRDYVISDEESTAEAPEPVWVSQSAYANQTPGQNRYMRDLHLNVKAHTETERLRWAEYKDQRPTLDEVVSTNAIENGKNYFLLPGREDWHWYGFFSETRPKEEIHPLFQVVTVDSSIMKGHDLPFDDDQRRDKFVATLMVLLSDSRVQYPDKPSWVEVESLPTAKPWQESEP